MSIPLLEPSDFEVPYDNTHTYPFFEDEDASGIYGYGHTNEKEFADAVNDYDVYTSGQTLEELEGGYGPEDVRHAWGYVTNPEDGRDLWRLGIRDTEALGTVPITWLSR